jgi:hypothetical protein
MEYTVDIDKVNAFIQKMRVHTFLDGLDDALDGLWAQVVLLSPFPTIEQAYGYIRRETTHQGIMMKGHEPNSVAMVSRGYKVGKAYEPQGKGFSHRDKAKLKYTNCGKGRHIKDQCFEIVGYPDWWKGDKKKKYEAKGKGIAATTLALGDNVANTQMSQPMQYPGASSQHEGVFTMQAAQTNGAQGTEEESQTGKGKDGIPETKLARCNITDLNKTRNSEGWVIDSRATDHMT